MERSKEEEGKKKRGKKDERSGKSQGGEETVMSHDKVPSQCITVGHRGSKRNSSKLEGR